MPKLSFVADNDMRVVSAGGTFLVVAGAKPGGVRAFYRSGALLVVPALNGGCGVKGLFRK